MSTIKNKGRNLVTNKGKATTAGALGGAVSTWLAIELQRRINLPAEVASELIALTVGSVGGFIARWAARLNPHE